MKKIIVKTYAITYFLKTLKKHINMWHWKEDHKKEQKNNSKEEKNKYIFLCSNTNPR